MTALTDPLAEMEAARLGPHITCPYSRHVAMMAHALAQDGKYAMLTEEPRHCAESLAVVVKALWEARAALVEREKQ